MEEPRALAAPSAFGLRPGAKTTFCASETGEIALCPKPAIRFRAIFGAIFPLNSRRLSVRQCGRRKSTLPFTALSAAGANKHPRTKVVGNVWAHIAYPAITRQEN